DLFQTALEGAHLALARLAARDLLGCYPVWHSRTDLVHARLQELRLARDQLEVALQRARTQTRVDASFLGRDQLLGPRRPPGFVLRRVLLRRGERLARAMSTRAEVRQRLDGGNRRVLG